GLVCRIADLAIVTAPAGALHVAGLAGAFAAAATVADGMVRVAARALALARRRVAGHADRAVTRPAARAFPRRTAHPELRGRRLRAQAAAAALVGAAGVPHRPRRVATHADLPAHPVGRLAAGPGHSPYKPPS